MLIISSDEGYFYYFKYRYLFETHISNALNKYKVRNHIKKFNSAISIHAATLKSTKFTTMKSIILLAVFVVLATALPTTTLDNEENSMAANIPVEQDDVKEESTVGEVKKENQQETEDESTPEIEEEVVEATTNVAVDAAVDEVTHVVDQQEEIVTDTPQEIPSRDEKVPKGFFAKIKAWFDKVMNKIVGSIFGDYDEYLKSLKGLWIH